MPDATLKIDASRKRPVLCQFGLVMIVFLVYAPTLGHPFVQWDDQVLIYENPWLNPPSWHALSMFWTHPFWDLYQPISMSAWAAIAWVAYSSDKGLSPVYFHSASIVTHAITVVLIFQLLRRSLDDLPAAFFGATFLAVHPLLADPVNWAGTYYTLLSNAFAVAAVIALGSFAIADNRRRQWVIAAVATFLFAVACLSKASAVAAIGLAPTVILFRHNGRRPVRVALVLMAWVLIALPVIAVTKHAQPAARVPNLNLSDRAAVALDALTFYARKVVWPWPMTIDYGRTPAVVLVRLTSASASERVGECVLLSIPIGVSIATFWLRRTWPELLLGWAWFVIALLPALGLTKFMFQHISTVADRYAALAMVGPAIAVAGAVRRWPRTQSAIIGVLAVCAVATVAQSTSWRDTKTLMVRAEQINSRSRVASAVLAEMLAKTDQFEPAQSEFRRAIANDPEAATPHFDYANLLAAHERLNDAIAQCRLAIDADPTLSQPHLNLGVALARSGDSTTAAVEIQRAISLNPTDPDAYADLGLVLSQQRKPEAAAQAYANALRLNPVQAQAVHGLQMLETAGNRRRK